MIQDEPFLVSPSLAELRSGSGAAQHPAALRGSTGRSAVSAWLAIVTLAAALLSHSAAISAPQSAALTDAAASPAFFNPSVGHLARLTLRVAIAGELHSSILDRNGLTVRVLPSVAVTPGLARLSWDGRDDRGVVVPDEAYSWRVEFSGRGRKEIYDPGAELESERESVTGLAYSRTDGLLTYTLQWPARVHVQAGQAKPDQGGHSNTGPVLKTVVDNRPRTAGQVVEHWNGFDESGTVFIPDLPHFAVAVAASRLPENVIIAVGNRHVDALQYDQRKQAGQKTTSLATKPEHDTPKLDLKTGASAHSANGTLLVGDTLSLHITPREDSAGASCAMASELAVFVDEDLVIRRENQASPAEVTIESIPAGEHRVVVNWVCGPGRVAVNVLRVAASPARPIGPKEGGEKP